MGNLNGCNLKKASKIWKEKHWTTLGCPPAQDASHHQDYYIFRIGDPNLNPHLPLASWEGGQPKNQILPFLLGFQALVFFRKSIPGWMYMNIESPTELFDLFGKGDLPDKATLFWLVNVAFMYCIYPSSHNHGGQKWAPPIVVTFQTWPCSTSMIMGARDNSCTYTCTDIVVSGRYIYRIWHMWLCDGCNFASTQWCPKLFCDSNHDHGIGTQNILISSGRIYVGFYKHLY